jgi:argininosuccinate lyase
LKRAAIAERLDRGYLDATALMEYLINRGTAQRTAHGLVGGLVARAMERGVSLSDLPLAEFQAADPKLDKSVYDVLGSEKAVAATASYGSTNPEHVAEQVGRWKKHLEIKS